MRTLLRQSAVTLLLAALLWAALDHALSRCPNVPATTVDTQNSPARLTHQSQLAHLVEELHLLAKTNRPKLIFFGGSSAEYAFRPGDLKDSFPGYEIHNLSLNGAYAGASVKQAHEIMRAAYFFIPPDARAKSIFVYGIIIQHFTAPEVESQFSPARMKMFSWFYKMQGGESVPRFGLRATALFHRIIRPFWILGRVVSVTDETNDLSGGIRWLRHTPGHDTLSGLETFDNPDDPDRRWRIQNDAEQTLGGRRPEEIVNAERFAALDEMLGFADTHSLRFVLVALPSSMGSDHPAMVHFLKEVEGVLARHGQSGQVSFLNHTDAMPESLMNDLYHIKLSASGHYSRILLRDWPYDK